MQPDDIYNWARILALIPALIMAYKIPSLIRWIRMKIAVAIAGAMTSQIMPVLNELQEGLSEVRGQIFPNGGGSMSDKLNKVLEASERTEGSVALLRQAMRAHQDADLSQARFETDDMGRFTWVSHAFLRWCNRSLDQVYGYGWINCIGLDDRDRVRSEWEAAITEGREFSMQFNMRTIEGKEFPVEGFAKPLAPPGSRAPQQWIGVIVKA